MKLNTKRFIAGVLIAFFFVYSIVIYTVGTRVGKGEKRKTSVSEEELHCMPPALWFGWFYAT